MDFLSWHSEQHQCHASNARPVILILLNPSTRSYLKRLGVNAEAIIVANLRSRPCNTFVHSWSPCQCLAALLSTVRQGDTKSPSCPSSSGHPILPSAALALETQHTKALMLGHEDEHPFQRFSHVIKTSNALCNIRASQPKTTSLWMSRNLMGLSEHSSITLTLGISFSPRNQLFRLDCCLD